MGRKNLLRTSLIFILLLVLVFSCDKETPTPFIEPDLEKYVDRFFIEAKRRGISLSRKKLEVVFVEEFSIDVNTSSVCGYGWSDFNGTGKQRVEVKNSGRCWHDRLDIEKENFMFHELGHAMLSRGHLATSFSNGYPRSIMCASQQVEIKCNNYQTYYQNDEMRTFYLDELFGQIIPDPEWTTNDNFIKALFSDSIGSVENEWQHFITNDDENLSQYDFYIDSAGVFPSNSLAISIGESVIDSSTAIWLHRFEINDFPECSAIKASADIKTDGLLYGYIDFGISLREYDNNNELYRFVYHRIRTFDVQDLNDQVLETEIYCIPRRSAVVTISFTVQSLTAAKVYFDNVHLELWN